MCLAVPGLVREVYDDSGTLMGKLDFGGVVKEVCLEFLPEISVGDYALVHVGFALSRIDESEAKAALKTFREIEEIEAEEIGDSGNKRAES